MKCRNALSSLIGYPFGKVVISHSVRCLEAKGWLNYKIKRVGGTGLYERRCPVYSGGNVARAWSLRRLGYVTEPMTSWGAASLSCETGN